jgi:NADPH-dependent glutamate synthase beta subunit-like oxidoreductase
MDLDELVRGHDAVMLCTGRGSAQAQRARRGFGRVYTGLAFLFSHPRRAVPEGRHAPHRRGGQERHRQRGGFSAIDVAHGALGQGAAG